MKNPHIPFTYGAAFNHHTHPQCRARDSHPGSSYFTASMFFVPTYVEFASPLARYGGQVVSACRH